jgi:mRNA interferase YafQ
MKKMLNFESTTQYRKDIKKLIKQGCDRSLLDEVIIILLEQKPLPPKYKDHALNGKYKNRVILTATRTGAHSELF